MTRHLLITRLTNSARFIALLLGMTWSMASLAQQTINEGLGGSWYNPATSGQGLFLDVMPSRGQIFMAYFTYQDDLDDSVQLPGGEQFWMTAQGSYQGNSATLTAYLTRGGWLDSEHPVETIVAGEVVIEFQSCTNATLTFNNLGPPLDVANLTIPIQRLTPDTLCESSR